MKGDPTGKKTQWSQLVRWHLIIKNNETSGFMDRRSKKDELGGGGAEWRHPLENVTKNEKSLGRGRRGDPVPERKKKEKRSPYSPRPV